MTREKIKMKQKAVSEEDWYKILGMFKENGEKMDWIPRAPRLTSLYGFTQPHADFRGFIYHLPKDEKEYIVAAKINIRNLRPERVEHFTGWGLSGRGGFPLISENVPDKVKSTAKDYLLNWLGWFGGKEYAKNVMARSKVEWKAIPINDPVNEETKYYFNH